MKQSQLFAVLMSAPGADSGYPQERQAIRSAEVHHTPADRIRLVKKLVKLPGIIVCLEATGIYHFDLSLAFMMLACCSWW